MIEFKNVSKTFKKKNTEITALNHINFKVHEGEIFGVIGYSGAGKSTLVRLVNQLEQQSSGDVYVDGHHLNTYNQKKLRHIKKDIGMIFQHFNLLNSKTVFKNVAMPLILSKTPTQEIQHRVNEMLSFVGLEGKAHQYPTELSGGQKQRVAIARALITQPKILLCDEATSALDPATTDAILDLLKKTNETFGVTILVITHEMSVIKKICHRVAVMENGEVIELDTVKRVFSRPQTPTAQRFVSTVINTTPSQQILKNKTVSMHTNIIKIFVESEQIHETLLQDIIRQYDVKVNVLHAFMTEIQEETVAYLWLEINGEPTQLSNVKNYLSSRQLHLEEVN